MYNLDAPSFPEYLDNGDDHVSTVQIPAFSGMQITNGPYGAVSKPGSSTGETHAIADKKIDPAVFRAAVSWVIERATDIKPLLFAALVDQYWEARDDVIDCLVDEDPNEVVPEIQEPEDLALLCGLVALYIGGMTPAGEPVFGIELGCNWESEHGAGVRFEGLKVVESGDASVAFCFR